MNFLFQVNFQLIDSDFYCNKSIIMYACTYVQGNFQVLYNIPGCANNHHNVRNENFILKVQPTVENQTDVL